MGQVHELESSSPKWTSNPGAGQLRRLHAKPLALHSWNFCNRLAADAHDLQRRTMRNDAAYLCISALGGKADTSPICRGSRHPMLVSAGTWPRFARCNAIGNIGGRNGSCRIAMVAGNSHSHSLAHVGARLAALGVGRADSYLRDSARIYATAHEWHLLFSWSDSSGPSRRLCPGALVKALLSG
jgi:hypothetical protein